MLAAVTLMLALSTGVVQGQEPLTVGAPARAFSLEAMNEDAAMEMVRQRMITLGELVGIQPAHPAEGVVIYFFNRASGGEGLRPINTLAKRYRSQGIRFLAISIDPEPEVADWVASLKLDYPVLRDNHKIVAERYGVRDTPMIVLVDSDGIVFSAGAPSMMELEATLSAQLQALTAETTE